MGLFSTLTGMSNVVTTISTGFQAVGRIAGEVWDWISDKVRAVIDFIVDIFDDIDDWWNTFEETIETLWDDITGFVDTFVEAIDFWPLTLFWEGFQLAVEAVWAAIGIAVDVAIGAIQMLFDGFIMGEIFTVEWWKKLFLFDWLDWAEIFEWLPPDVFTLKYWTDLFDFSWLSWVDIFDFFLPDWLLDIMGIDLDELFSFEMSFEDIFRFLLPDWLQDILGIDLDKLFSMDLTWGQIFSFMLPDWLEDLLGIDLQEVFDVDWKEVFTLGDVLNVMLLPINGIIAGFEGFVNLMIDGINWFIGVANDAIYYIPGVPYIGGEEDWQIGAFSMGRLSFGKGGIATGPTGGYMAELHGTEAVVPLPDGRSIPVEMKGNSGNQTFNITVEASGITDRTDKRAMARDIGNMIQQEMARTMGGSTKRGRFA